MVNTLECQVAGLDERTVQNIAKRISRAGFAAKQLGLKVFGGSGSGTLRFYDKERERWLIIADLDGNFDGGDGGQQDIDGLMYGE